MMVFPFSMLIPLRLRRRAASNEINADLPQMAEIGDHPVPARDFQWLHAGARGDDVSGLEAPAALDAIVDQPGQRRTGIAQDIRAAALARELAVLDGLHGMTGEIDAPPVRHAGAEDEPRGVGIVGGDLGGARLVEAFE